MLSYNDVITRALLNKIDDPVELNYNDTDLFALYTSRLHSAVSKPFVRKLFSSLKLDDEVQTINFELTTPVDEDSDNEYVTELLALGVAIEWLEPKVKSKKNVAKFFGGKEEKKLKDDYKLNMEMLKSMRVEQQNLIRDHGYAFLPYSETE